MACSDDKDAQPKTQPAQMPSERIDPEEPAAEPTEPAEPAEPESVDPQVPTPHPDLPPDFDPETTLEFDARIVDLHKRAGWAPCGIIHSVGAVEVEVLGHGDPGPHLILFVSCPADFGKRSGLVVDGSVHVMTFKRRQMWQPKPLKNYRDDLPIRYVKSVRRLEPMPITPSAPRSP